MYQYNSLHLHIEQNYMVIVINEIQWTWKHWPTTCSQKPIWRAERGGACNPDSRGSEVGVVWVQVYPGIYTNFEVSLGYIARPFSKIKTNQPTENKPKNTFWEIVN